MQATLLKEAEAVEVPSPSHPAASAAPDRSSGRWRALALLILLLGGALRFWQLAAFPPTHDEMYTITLTRLPARDRLVMTANDVHPPLYYELQASWNRLWTRLLGRPAGLRSMRLLPLGLGLAAVAVILFGLGRWVGRREALWMAAFWALNPLAIGYAQTLRSYSLAVLAVLGCLVAFLALRWGATPRQRLAGALGLALAGLTLLYTHLIGGLFLAALGLYWLAGALIRHRQKWPWREGLLAFGLIGLGFVPWLFNLAHQVAVYRGHNAHHVVWATLRDLLADPFFTFPFGSPNVPAPVKIGLALVAAACLLVALPGFFLHGSPRGAAAQSRIPRAWLLGWLSFIGLFAYALAWWISWRKIMLLKGPTQVLLALPLMLIFGLVFAAGRPRKRLADVAGLVLLALMLASALARPLVPANGSYLWASWRAQLPASLRPLAEGDRAHNQPPASRVVYPDYWAGLIPPEPGQPTLIPFSAWVESERSRREPALLLEVMTHLQGFTEGETALLSYVLLAARQASGYPPAQSHDAGVLEAHTTLLRPFAAEQLAAQYQQSLRATPHAAELFACRRAVSAAGMKSAAAQSFYSLEHDEAFRFWRWTQGARCRLDLPGPFTPGPMELLLCLDRPQPYPRSTVAWPWRLSDAAGRLVARGEVTFPCGPVMLFRLPLRLEAATAQLTLELEPAVWQPTAIDPGTTDLRLLGGRFFWVGLHETQ